MSSTDNIIILKSSDGESFEVKEAVALQFGTIHQMIAEIGLPAEGIALPNVTSRILSKVIEYCKKHVDDTDRDSSVAGDDLKAWDAEFVKVDKATLSDLMLAANYLDMKGLLDLACCAMADMIKSLPPEELRKMFAVRNTFTPEEEEEIRGPQLPPSCPNTNMSKPTPFFPQTRVIHCQSGMDFFRNAKAVRLRSCDGQYLVAVVDEVVILHDGETRLGESTWQGETGRQDSTRWSVEFTNNSNSVLRLKSCYGTYLAASNQPSLSSMTGCKVLLSLPSLLDSSLELEPVMEGTHVKLRTHYGTFLCANCDHPMYPNSITHDLPHRTTILWDVEVVEREGTATKIDDKASKEGSSSNNDDKASSATKRHHEAGEGSSVTKSPSGDSGSIREGDWVRYRDCFWKLKRRILDKECLFIWKGPGMTALIREVCADVREHFDTIAWISIPQEKDSALIREEIFLQLIYERVTLPENFDMNTWMLKDHDDFLQQKARCLIVVDNLDNPKTWKKLKEILRMVKTCKMIFIVNCEMDSSYSQIKEHGRKFEPYEQKSYLPQAHYLRNFPEKGFPPPLKRLCVLIVSKCKRLPTAMVCVLRNREKQRRYCSSDTIKYEWEVRIPSDNLCDEFHVIQQVLKTLFKGLHTDLYEDEGHDELDPIQQVVDILLTDELLFRFLYLSILPENRPLSCKTVSRLWDAEGFPTDPKRAELFFEFLLSKKCILPVEKRSGVLSTFQVDKRVREIIVSLSDLCEPVIITSQGSTKWPEGVRFQSVRGTISALNVEKTSPLSSIFVDVSSDEYKTTTSKALPSETSDTSLLDLKHSKVLDLTGARFRIIPDVLFELTNARYLSLRNSSIKVIPSSTRKLTHLEFLDAKHSLVTELPQEVEILEKIRHILIYHHKRDPLMESYNLIGFKSLCRVGGFKNLEVLCFVEADERILTDLGNLTKLMRLGITNLRKEQGKPLCTSLGKLKLLKSLNLHALDEDEILDLHDRTSPPESKSQTSPPKSLKHLYLHGRLEKLPDWILSPNDLTKIILRWSQLEEDLLATFGKLPELVELELRRAYDGEQLDFKKGQFPKLKILLLEELEGLRSMSLEKGTMPSLENLTICRCQWLERVPSGIQDIGIQKLTFFDMSHEFYEKVREDHEKDNYRIFEHISEVYFRRWRAGHWETHQVDSTDEEVESTDGIRLEKFYSFK